MDMPVTPGVAPHTPYYAQPQYAQGQQPYAQTRRAQSQARNFAPPQRDPRQGSRVVQAARWQELPTEGFPPADPGAAQDPFPPFPDPNDPGAVPGGPTETAPPETAPLDPTDPGDLPPPPAAFPPSFPPSLPGDPSTDDLPPAEPPVEPSTAPATDRRDDTSEFQLDSPFNYTPYNAPPDEYTVCPECHGYCCNYCGAKWFARAEFQGLMRSHTETNAGLTRGTLIANTTFGLPTVSVFSETLMDTEAAEYQLEPGIRFTLGHFLGFDDRGRMHSLEAAYFGQQDWQIEGQLTGKQITYIGPDLNHNGSVIPDDFITSGNLLSFYNLDVGGFNRAEQHSFMYRSALHSASFDYRVRWNVGRDKLVAKHDGRWVKEFNSGWAHSLHGGFRYININEDFEFHARGTSSVNAGPAQQIRGDYNASTDNDLFGLQAGADLTRQWEKWSFGARGLFGVLANFSTLNGRIVTSDPLYPLSGDPNLTNVDNSFEFAECNLAIVGETGFQLAYRLRPHWNLRASYDFYWVQGVALAAEQFADHQVIGPNSIDSEGYTFYHGPAIGADFVW